MTPRFFWTSLFRPSPVLHLLLVSKISCRSLEQACCFKASPVTVDTMRYHPYPSHPLDRLVSLKESCTSIVDDTQNDPYNMLAHANHLVRSLRQMSINMADLSGTFFLGFANSL